MTICQVLSYLDGLAFLVGTRDALAFPQIAERISQIPGAKGGADMQATTFETQVQARGAVEQYLGFAIQQNSGSYMASPLGWQGEVLLAESMPVLRRKIWRWWHQVQ